MFLYHADAFVIRCLHFNRMDEDILRQFDDIEVYSSSLTARYYWSESEEMGKDE